MRRVIGIALLVSALGGGACALALQLKPARSGTVWRQVFFDGFSRGLRHDWWGRYSGQPGGDPGGWWAPSHVTVQHGIVSLQTYRDRRFGGRWVSGGISSARALKQTYGKYEVRLRMDRGKGVAVIALLWPVADRWPPEIDFAEHGGGNNARDHITATLHYGASNSQIQRSARRDFSRWHTVGVEWTPGRLVYTLDGRAWSTVRTSAVPSERMEMAIQTQAGTCGDVSAPCPDRVTPARIDAEIDWVAAYAYRPRSR